MANHHIRSQYLDLVYDTTTLPQIISDTAKCVKELSPELIAFRGSSGAAVAFAVGALLQVPLVHVRKSLGHYGRYIEGVVGPPTYVIIDDFICTGSTIDAIREQLEDEYRLMGFPEPKLTGIILYNTPQCITAVEWGGVPIHYARKVSQWL